MHGLFASSADALLCPLRSHPLFVAAPNGVDFLTTSPGKQFRDTWLVHLPLKQSITK